MVQIYFAKRNGGIFKPEFRLLTLPIPIFEVAGLFMCSLGTYYGVHWILDIIRIAFIVIALSVSVGWP